MERSCEVGPRNPSGEWVSSFPRPAPRFLGSPCATPGPAVNEGGGRVYRGENGHLVMTALSFSTQRRVFDEQVEHRDPALK